MVGVISELLVPEGGFLKSRVRIETQVRIEIFFLPNNMDKVNTGCGVICQ